MKSSKSTPFFEFSSRESVHQYHKDSMVVLCVLTLCDFVAKRVSPTTFSFADLSFTRFNSKKWWYFVAKRSMFSFADPAFTKIRFKKWWYFVFLLCVTLWPKYYFLLFSSLIWFDNTLMVSSNSRNSSIC